MTAQSTIGQAVEMARVAVLAAFVGAGDAGLDFAELAGRVDDVALPLLMNETARLVTLGAIDTDRGVVPSRHRITAEGRRRYADLTRQPAESDPGRSAPDVDAVLAADHGVDR